jgi:deoxycytidylate deaminase
MTKFTPPVKNLLTEIRQLKKEVCDRVARPREQVPALAPEERNDTNYTSHFIGYIKWIDELAAEYKNRIEKIAEDISKIEGRGWQENEDIVRLWIELARTVEYFRHDPVKGAGAIYVSPANKMICYGAGGFAAGLDMTPHAHLESRRPYRHCGERKGPCDFMDLRLPEIDKAAFQDNALPGRLDQARVELLHDSLMKAPKQPFAGSILFTTVAPCMPCAQFIDAAKIGKVYVNKTCDLRPYRRLASMKAGEKHLRDKGVEILKL